MSEQMKLNSEVDLSDANRPVVMVDDDEMDYICALRYFDRSSLQNPMLHFCDGVEFLAYLDDVKRGDKALPGLVLMDVNMPYLNGFEVVKKMREDDIFCDIPVVAMLSSSTDPLDRERAVEAGANCFLVKPFNPKDYKTFFESLAG